MRGIVKNSVAAIAAILATAEITGFARPAAVSAQAAGGITITPATLTLSLEKGAAEKTADFTIKNTYNAPVTLQLSFAQPIVTPGTGEAARAPRHLSITPGEVTIGAGESVRPVLTLKGSDELAPGSQQVELVISQLGTGGGNVSIIPSVRLPLAIIKQDGAVTKLSAGNITKPSFAFDLPGKTGFTVENTGNMTAIPRGYVRVLDPRGREVSGGVFNAGSAAVTPGSQLRLTTGLTALNPAWLPGLYRVQVSYGTGGGTTAGTATASFFYLPVWNVLLVGLLGAMAYCGRQIWIEWRKLQRLRQNGPPKGPGEPLTAGRANA